MRFVWVGAYLACAACGGSIDAPAIVASDASSDARLEAPSDASSLPVDAPTDARDARIDVELEDAGEAGAGPDPVCVTGETDADRNPCIAPGGLWEWAHTIGWVQCNVVRCTPGAVCRLGGRQGVCQ